MTSRYTPCVSYAGKKNGGSDPGRAQLAEAMALSVDRRLRAMKESDKGKADGCSARSTQQQIPDPILIQALPPHSTDRLTLRIMILTAANASLWRWFQCFDPTQQSLKIPTAEQPGSIRGPGCRDPMREEIEDANASVAVMHGPFLQKGFGMLSNEKAGGAPADPSFRVVARPQRTTEIHRGTLTYGSCCRPR